MARLASLFTRSSREQGFRSYACAALVLFCAIAGHAQAQSAPETIVRTWLDQFRATGWSVETAGIAYSQGSDTLEVRGLTFKRTDATPGMGGSITVPSATFTGLAPADGGGVSARSISVPTIVAKFDYTNLTLSIGPSEVRDLFLPAATGAPPFDPAKPFTSFIQRWKTVVLSRAGSLDVGPIAVDARIAEGAISLMSGGLSVQAWDKGRASSIVSEPVKLKVSEQNSTIDFNVGKSETLDYDLNAAIKVFDDTAYPNGKGDGEWRQVFKSQIVDSFSIVSGPLKFSIGRVSTLGQKLRQEDTPINDLYDRLLTDPSSLDNDPDAALRSLTGYLRSISIERLAFDELSASGPELERFRIGRTSMIDYSPDGIGEIRLEGLDFAASDSSAGLTDLSIGKIMFPTFEAVQKAWTAAQNGSDADVLSIIPTVGSARLVDVKIGAPDIGTLSLGLFSLELKNYIKAIPTEIGLALRNLVLPPTLLNDNSAKDALSDLKYDAIDLSADIRARWDEGSSDLKINELSATFANGGTIRAEGTLSNIPRAVFENPETIQDALAGAALRDLSISYKDASLIGRVMDLAAQRSGKRVDDYRNGVIGALPSALLGIPDVETRAGMTSALAIFLREPKTLTASTRLTAPLPLTQIIGTAAAAPRRLLGILPFALTANE